MRRVRIALAQVNPTVGAIESNARMVIEGMEQARNLGADIATFRRGCSLNVVFYDR